MSSNSAVRQETPGIPASRHPGGWVRDWPVKILIGVGVRVCDGLLIHFAGISLRKGGRGYAEEWPSRGLGSQLLTSC